ncbi:MAG: hypothetical protein ABI433_03275 [Burkholderiaceae bacterium]
MAEKAVAAFALLRKETGNIAFIGQARQGGNQRKSHARKAPAQLEIAS